MSSTTEAMGDTKEPELRRKLINTNLISLKCLLFLFFGGLGCLVPFLPLHMLAVGLTAHEVRTISMIAPVVSILGPLLAGPLADRVAASRHRAQAGPDKPANPSNGRYLRVMIAVCCVFSALFYALLLVVPSVKRIHLPDDFRPAVKFTCDASGAIVHQERCRDTIGCLRRENEDLVGNLLLSKCEYACYPYGERYTGRSFPPVEVIVTTEEPTTEPPDFESSGELGVIPLETESPISSETKVKRRRYAPVENGSPHVCYNKADQRYCHVFASSRGSPTLSGDSRGNLTVSVSLHQALNPEDAESWCAYPVAQFFECRVPRAIEDSAARLNRSCLVECALEHPYDENLVEGSVLAESQCKQVIGNEQLTFWMYLAIRCLADIFPVAAVALLNAAIVIATRETSTGRGDVGRQLVFASLGFCAFGPLSGYLSQLLGNPSYYVPILMHAVLVLLTACVALTANGMPLSPPEWWWHTRSGMLALPMSSVRKYGGESAALFFVLVVLGAFWSTISSYLSIYLLDLKGDELSIGLALTVGAIPALFFLWRSEHLVDYCGHSNLLITAFITYILRFTGLNFVPDVWWVLIPQILELFTLSIMWVTSILYFRHLISRQLTTTGQALPVIAHFCIGRAIGAVVGACVDKVQMDNDVEAMRYIYHYMAIAAAVIATVYFVLYHGVLKPRCHAQSVQGAHKQPATIVQAMNGNGNYTPLRVYHNGMGRKGQFRY